jgi:CheY-like chemotaxis protein
MIPQRIADNTPFGAEDAAVTAERQEPEKPAEPKVIAQKKAAPAGDTQKKEETEKQERPYTVMVVDDNLLYLKEMDAWLRNLDLKTIMAKSGRECLKILEKKKVDLVFMDQMMPGMDGTQALQELRKLERVQGRPQVPVVVLTADDSAGARERYMQLGFDDYLSKPIEAQRIQEQVQKYMHEKNRKISFKNE